MNTLNLLLANQVNELERMEAAVSGFLRECRVAPQLEMEVNLVLEEVFMNIIRHGYGGSGKQDIALELSVDGGELKMRFEDTGRPFDPSDQPPPDLARPLEQRPVGGLGIHLVRSLTDSLQYERFGGTNRLTIIKRLPEPHDDCEEQAGGRVDGVD